MDSWIVKRFKSPGVRLVCLAVRGAVFDRDWLEISSGKDAFNEFITNFNGEVMKIVHSHESLSFFLSTEICNWNISEIDTETVEHD